MPLALLPLLRKENVHHIILKYFIYYYYSSALLTIVRVYKLYLLTYLLITVTKIDQMIWYAIVILKNAEFLKTGIAIFHVTLTSLGCSVIVIKTIQVFCTCMCRNFFRNCTETNISITRWPCSASNAEKGLWNGRPSVCLSICLSIPSIDSSSGVRRVCCWAPCGQEISINSGGRRHPAATAPQHGVEQQTRAVTCWQPRDNAEHRLVVLY